MADEISGAPAAPAAESAPPIPVTPAAEGAGTQAGDRASFASAIASFKDGGAAPEVDSAERPDSDHHSRRQPREDGRFAGPPAEPDPDAPTAAEVDRPELPTAAEPDSANPAAEGGEPGSGEPEEQGEPFVLKLPARHADQPDEEIAFDGLTAEQQERLAQLRNGYMRGEEVRQQGAYIQAAFEEALELQAEMQADPVHFLGVNQVSPAVKVELLKYLAADLFGSEEHWAEFAELTEQWGADGTAREAFLRQMQEGAKQREQQRPPPEARQTARVLRQTLSSFVPHDAPDREAERFLQYAEDAVIDAIEATGQLPDIRNPDAVGTIIKRVVDAFGYGRGAPAPQDPRPAAPRATVRPAAGQPAPGATAAPEARVQGTRLVEASERRRELAVTPSGPVGGGAGAAPPKGFREAAAWVRNQR